VAGYNNEIFIATTSQTLGGVNTNINDSPVPSSVSTTDTGEEGLVKPQSLDFSSGNSCYPDQQ